MGEEEPKRVEPETPPPPPPLASLAAKEDHTLLQEEDKTPDDVVSVKSQAPPLPQNKPPESLQNPAFGTTSLDSVDRDALLAKVEEQKRLGLIKAWEDSEKTKAENKAYRKLSAIGAWENKKRASVEAQLREIEEKFERKKAEYAEKMSNKMAEIHKAAEEKRAMVEAKRGEDFLKVEETVAKFRATGKTPRKLFPCFGC